MSRSPSRELNSVEPWLFAAPILWLVAAGLLIFDGAVGYPSRPLLAYLVAALLVCAAGFGLRYTRDTSRRVRVAERLLLVGWTLGLLPFLVFTCLRIVGADSRVPETNQHLLDALLLLALLPVWPLLQRWIDHGNFGLMAPIERLPLEFAGKIPAAFERDELRRILVEDVMPSLQVGQSALLLFEGQQPEPLYVQGLDPGCVPTHSAAVKKLLGSAGTPREAAADDPPQLRWIRLAVALEARREPIGLWLFGRRAPDDAYSRSDVEVLRSLANQITAVLRAKTEIERRRRLQDQLIQSQKMEAIGRLSAGVAHDFNNLLSAILGYSDLLLSGRPDVLGKQRSFVEGIKEAGEKAAALTNQLLAFSRQQVMTARVVDLNELVAQLENLLRRVIEEDIELRTEFHRGGDLYVRVDPGQMEQVLLNLVVNACDAMGDGGHLTITTGRQSCSESAPCHREVPAGEYVTLKVTDDGSGIAADVRDRIFEPFFTTKVPGQGTGLGLAMVYGIVNQSHGHIAVDSEVGTGTSFTLYLPAASTAPTPRPLLQPERLAASGPETILMVEDEQSVRRVVREILRSRGYTVLSADHGQAALELADSHDGPIDLLLTDVMMPHLKGPELADLLQRRRPGIKVVFMSGYNEDQVLGERLRAGGTVLIRKPFAPETLAREIRKALDGKLTSIPA